MKLKVIRWTALLVETGLSFFILSGVIFAGAYYIEGLRNGVESVKEPDADFFSLLTAILIIVSVIIAWFKIRLGGFLLTIFSLASIIFFYETEVAWMQIAILPIGPLLLFYVYYNRWLLKKESS